MPSVVQLVSMAMSYERGTGLVPSESGQAISMFLLKTSSMATVTSPSPPVVSTQREASLVSGAAEPLLLLLQAATASAPIEATATAKPKRICASATGNRRERSL